MWVNLVLVIVAVVIGLAVMSDLDAGKVFGISLALAIGAYLLHRNSKRKTAHE